MKFHWLQAKLNTTDIISLIADFAPGSESDPSTSLALLKDTLRLSTHVLVRDKNQLAGQLVGRLSALPKSARLYTTF